VPREDEASGGADVAVTSDIRGTEPVQEAGDTRRPELDAYAARRHEAIVAALSARVLAEGSTPFLHVNTANGAKRIYESAGFRVHQTIQLTVLQRTPDEVAGCPVQSQLRRPCVAPWLASLVRRGMRRSGAPQDVELRAMWITEWRNCSIA
jgi:hypothetical protein